MFVYLHNTLKKDSARIKIENNIITNTKNHKKIFLLLTATLLCATSVITSCKKDEETTKVSEEKSGIALIVKQGQIEYWHQIESIFRGICQEKGLEAYYYPTTSEIAY